jgi:hypothetical protein
MDAVIAAALIGLIGTVAGGLIYLWRAERERRNHGSDNPGHPLNCPLLQSPDHEIKTILAAMDGKMDTMVTLLAIIERRSNNRN